METKNEIKKSTPTMGETATKVLSVFGLVVVILLLLFGIFAMLRSLSPVWRALSNAFVSVTSVFEPNAKRLEVRTDKESIVSGETLNVSWQPASDRSGSYDLSYECVDGINFELITTDGNKQFVFCNTLTSFVSQANSVKLVPTLSNKDSATIQVNVYFTESGDNKPSASGSVNVNVKKSSTSVNTNTTNTNTSNTTTNTTTNTTGNTTQAAGPLYPNYVYPYNTYSYNNNYVYPNYGSGYTGYYNPSVTLYGRPDLSVRVIDTGRIDRYTNLYTPTTALSAYDRVAVKFEVTNTGTNRIDSWIYNVSLPTNPYYLYTSIPQQTLNPGDRIQFVIAFDSIQARADNQVVISADPQNTIQENDESNNVVIQNIRLINY